MLKWDTLPFPGTWVGPRRPYKHTDFKNVPIWTVQSPEHLWFALDDILFCKHGPGWAGETAWSYGGVLVGFVGGIAGIALGSAAGFQNSSANSNTLLFSLIAVPLVFLPIITPIWMAENQQSESRENHRWTRRGSSALGLISGAAIYFVFPLKSESTTLHLALINAALGTVVGYRLG